SAEQTEESSEEVSEVSEEESITGSLFRQYYEAIKSGTYMLKTTESRMAGGEAIPYTVTAYHRNGIIYATIEESYGSTSEYIVKDGKLIILDSFMKTALIIDYSESLFSEKQLWTGAITLEESGTQMLYDTQYNYEAYTDSTGFEFTLFFNEDILKRYRSYNSKLMDTIVISISVSGDISGALFEIPEGYTITDTTE
ncbi:MAG: hypothetical protein PHW77_07840, partial [Eubacteriales bacterium]|nr:hypothetical protein [Eubacteriales bacterium]